MKIEIWCIGKTQENYLLQGIKIFEQRLKHYLPVELVIIPSPKSKGLNAKQLQEKEGQLVLKRLNTGDRLILLDEKGKHFNSVKFAAFIERQLNRPGKRMVFLIGGAFGFSEAIYKKADETISLSEMTFSHQMVRLFFMEQLYRAMTILRNEPYHNS